MTSQFPAHVRPIFDGPGGYPIRLGWLQKTHSALTEDPGTFARDDATVRLGVGSSMTTPMRFWSQAAKLSRPLDARKPGTGLTPTQRGRWLLDDAGADPWLEDTGSHWLIHWWLLAPPCRVPVLYWALSRWPFTAMPRGDLKAAVLRAAAASGWRTPASSSVERDISALVRMYTPQAEAEEGSRAAIEDLMNSPMRELCLLGRYPDGRPSIAHTAGRLAPDAVVAFAVLEYVHRQTPQPGSIALSRLATDTDGPGRLLRIDTPALRRALQRTAARWPALDVVDSVGTEQVTFGQPPLELAWDILDTHYGNARSRTGTSPQAEAAPVAPGVQDGLF
jgi:hypothetical protein